MPAARWVRRARRCAIALLLVAASAVGLLAARHVDRGRQADVVESEMTGSPYPSSDDRLPDPSAPLGLEQLRDVDPASRACLLGRPARAVDADAVATRWRRDLDDRFNTLDTARWNVRDHEWLDHDIAYLLADNVTTSNGRLAIRARRESIGGRAFTSGYVDTNGTYALPNTFQVRVRAKVPMVRGLWPAPLWLRPADRSGGEIDLVETTHRPGERPEIHHSIHTAYGPRHQVDARRFPSAGIGDRTGTQWHTYTLRKTPGLMVMWVDDEVTAAFCSGAPGWYDTYYDAGKQWNLRINLQVGGWGGRPRAGQVWTDANATLLVDRVTTWVRRGPHRAAGQ